MPESSRWSPSFSYRHQNPVCFFVPSNVCHMSHPAHFPSFPSCDQPNIWQGLQIIGHLIMQLFSSSHYFLQLKAASLLPLTFSCLMTYIYIYIYICCTALLTSRRCILYIYSTNIHTEYFKHAAHSLFFPLQNVVYFIMLPFFGSCIIHILNTGCAKI
jgi:hypothetical protein